MQGYCMKERAQREMVRTKLVTMKNGRPATEGYCAVCGTKIYRLGRSA